MEFQTFQGPWGVPQWSNFSKNDSKPSTIPRIKKSLTFQPQKITLKLIYGGFPIGGLKRPPCQIGLIFWRNYFLKNFHFNAKVFLNYLLDRQTDRQTDRREDRKKERQTEKRKDRQNGSLKVRRTDISREGQKEEQKGQTERGGIFASLYTIIKNKMGSIF